MLELCTGALAGQVVFEPEQVLVTELGQINFDVSVVVEQNEVIDYIDLLIGSDDGVSFVGFDFDPGFASQWPFHGATIGFGSQYYPNSIFAGGFTFDPVPGGAFTGTLTVDLTGLIPGVYSFGVSTDRDAGLSSIGYRGAGEPVVGEVMIGFATITVVPEPATLTLLGLGLAAAAARRGRATRTRYEDSNQPSQIICR